MIGSLSAFLEPWDDPVKWVPKPRLPKLEGDKCVGPDPGLQKPLGSWPDPELCPAFGGPWDGSVTLHFLSR